LHNPRPTVRRRPPAQTAIAGGRAGILTSSREATRPQSPPYRSSEHEHTRRHAGPVTAEPAASRRASSQSAPCSPTIVAFLVLCNSCLHCAACELRALRGPLFTFSKISFFFSSPLLTSASLEAPSSSLELRAAASSSPLNCGSGSSGPWLEPNKPPKPSRRPALPACRKPTERADWPVEHPPPFSPPSIASMQCPPSRPHSSPSDAQLLPSTALRAYTRPNPYVWH